MLFAKPVDYAIRALTYLAALKDKGPTMSATIARDESIPAAYLVKILGTLTSA